jgi:hypothetical protein
MLKSGFKLVDFVLIDNVVWRYPQDITQRDHCLFLHVGTLLAKDLVLFSLDLDFDINFHTGDASDVFAVFQCDDVFVGRSLSTHWTLELLKVKFFFFLLLKMDLQIIPLLNLPSHQLVKSKLSSLLLFFSLSIIIRLENTSSLS